MEWLSWLEKKQGGTGGTRKYWLYTDGKTSKESGWHNQIHSDDNDEMERGSVKITHDTGYGGEGYFGVTLRNHLSDSQRSHINQQIKENRYHREPDNVTFDHGHNNNDTIGSSKKHYPKYSHSYIPKDDDYKNAAWEDWLEKGKKVQLTIAGWNEEAIHQKAPKKKVKFREDDDKGGAWEDSGYAKNASWESWLEKVDEPPTKITIFDIKEDDSFEEKQRKLHQLSNYNDSQDMNEGVTTVGGNIDQQRVHKLLKNNAIETSHKDEKEKEEWDGKFSSSTIEDEVKDDKDDKAVSEEEPLDELTEGKLEEIEKLKSWEAWLEKDALDGKGGNEAKDDLMMPSFMGMYKKPTKQTKEGQARDYLRDTPHVESYHSRRLGHGEKYESGKRPLEKKPQSGGFVTGTRKEEWDITADQDAQQRGSGINIFDDKDDNEPSGGFIQGQGRTVPKTGIAPNIKPQGKGVKHKGRPRGSKNKAWEAWLEKGRWDKPKTTAVDNHLKEESGRDTRVEVNELNAEIGQEATNERLDEAGRTGMFKPTDTPNFTTKKPKYVKGVEQTGDDISQSKEHLNIDIAHENKSWEGWLEKGRRITGEVIGWGGKTPSESTHLPAEGNRGGIGLDNNQSKEDVATHARDKVPTRNAPKWVEDKAENQYDRNDIMDELMGDIRLRKSWEGWLEKMQGAGDARFGNQHLTGLDQKPVDNEEDEANILPEKDVNTDEKDEKQEETEDKDDKDNKPYKALSHE